MEDGLDGKITTSDLAVIPEEKHTWATDRESNPDIERNIKVARNNCYHNYGGINRPDSYNARA
ncbi:hypothetical protein SCALIN_C17_0045 [Candidatus Scalindua japonica]|uniref:Uncharacterized protein n=1 Tax=Candidatus Scalindua japonica TaxID=1284222 RepID=A0A286TYQ0_9BACT|nr:hypothetical protein SCALIN_C17_0045 [Candidatus Scalindua japonica]